MTGVARNWTALALAAAISIALAACGSGGSSTGSTARATAPQPAKAQPSKSTPAEKPQPAPAKKPKPIPTVKVIGGAPPTAAGPAQLSFRLGQRVRFRVVTDEPFSFEVLGLGIAKTVDSSAIVSFEATKAGQFPVIASATSIGVADLIVTKR